jgi:hypothetical protein
VTARPAEGKTVEYDRVRELFTVQFPAGGFSSCDFRPHFDGHGHNAWVEILPEASIEATRRAAFAWLAEMVDALRPLRLLFGSHDRIQFTVGFPATVKPASRKILRGWFPAVELDRVVSPDFAAVGGAVGENNDWHLGLWDR